MHDTNAKTSRSSLKQKNNLKIDNSRSQKKKKDRLIYLSYT